MKILSLILILIFISSSCSTPVDKTFERVEVDSFYRQSNIIKYFLPTLPSWANFSKDLNCRRDKQVRYLDIKSVTDSFDLNFEQALALQYTFNNDLNVANLTTQKNLTLKEEEQLFFGAQDKIKADLRTFKTPEASEVNFLIVDNIINKKKNLRKSIEKFLTHDAMASGKPAFISFCFTHSEVHKILKELRMELDSIPVITYESFSYFNSDYFLTMTESVDLKAVVGSEKKVNVFMFEDIDIETIKGKYKKIIIK